MKRNKRIFAVVMVLAICLTLIPAQEASAETLVTTSSFGNNMYMLFDDSMNWDEAQEYCESLGGHLVTITSQEEQDFVAELVATGSKKNYWIGGLRDEDKKFTWITGESFSYTNWAPGEPRGHSGENYVHMMKEQTPYSSGNSIYKWNDIRIDGIYPREEDFFGTEHYGFICEIENGADANTSSQVVPDEPETTGTTGDYQLGCTSINVGVKLRWNLVSGASGYRVYRSESRSETGTPIINVSIEYNQFVDVNVDGGKTYYYRICPILSNGTEGDYSEPIEVTTSSSLSAGDGSGTRQFILMTLGDPYMIVNGTRAEIDPGRGTVPLTVSSRTLVPIRAIVEAMGGSVTWTESSGQIGLSYSGNNVTMWMDQKNLTVNGSSGTMDVAPTSINDRTMVPIRFAAENLNCEVDWINSENQVVIVYY